MPHTTDRAKTGHPTCHVKVIRIKQEIIWTGGLPHLGRLPHLPEVPHLYQNRLLIDIDMLFESIIRRNAASWCSIYLRTAFINISALKYGNYSRAAFNQINTIHHIWRQAILERKLTSPKSNNAYKKNWSILKQNGTQLFIVQITLSNGYIAIQRISVNKEYCAIHNIEIYTVVIVIEQSGPAGQLLVRRVI